MNTKINFITNTEVPGEVVKAKQQTEYSFIVGNLDKHYKLKNNLKKKWDNFIEEPEYEVLKEDEVLEYGYKTSEDQLRQPIIRHVYKIRCKSDRIILATVDDEELAMNISILINLAFREGAKQIIKVLEEL